MMLAAQNPEMLRQWEAFKVRRMRINRGTFFDPPPRNSRELWVDHDSHVKARNRELDRLAKLNFELANNPLGKIRPILQLVAKEFDLHPANVLGESRLRTAIVPRHLVMYLAYKHTSYSLLDICQRIGKRNHTTTLNAIRRTEQRIRTDDAFRSLAMRLSDGLKAYGIEGGHA